PPRPPLFPYTRLFRSLLELAEFLRRVWRHRAHPLERLNDGMVRRRLILVVGAGGGHFSEAASQGRAAARRERHRAADDQQRDEEDRKSTRLNYSHLVT